MRRDDNFYCNARLDRSARERVDPEWVAGLLARSGCRFVPVWKGKNLIARGDAPAAVTVDRGALGAALENGAAQPLLLGLRGAEAIFAVDLSHHEDPHALGLDPAHEFVDLRQVGAYMDDEEAALLAYARGLAYWHLRHRFCGRCGGSTDPVDGGHSRRCGTCGTQDFPRTDPAVIMLITHGDKALMGQSPRFPQGLYSTLAGFVEVGESLEGAVRREVREEAGIVVGDVRYHSSQAWPFPRSLMLGFYGEAETTEIDFDPKELLDCRWFSRDEVAALERKRLELMPRSESISRRLIYEWLNRR
ncbi:MAG: NAD(+) diphosphatase [Acetobacterales bacterium]